MSDFLTVTKEESLISETSPRGQFLPFTAYLITGTAGAGKSTSVSALAQNLNCLVTGATTVAAQNLSKSLRTHCPTIYSAFGFKSRHINFKCNTVQKYSDQDIGSIQRLELEKYWPVIADIRDEVMEKTPRGQYSHLSECGFNTLIRMSAPSLWTSNIIIIDEAGTLNSYVLSAVIFFYWFYNCWLDTPLFREGRVPCVVAVGSPTQTNAFASTYNHVKQSYNISYCDNVLSFLIGNKCLADYVDLDNHWALFINNKRCVDVEFGHLLKTLEYNLELSEDLLSYVDRFVVPKAKILDPLEYVGWTRLFLSHQEVKDFLSSLHAALTISGQATASISTNSIRVFMCPIICEISVPSFREYCALINRPEMKPAEWLLKNLYRLSNYSQFVDQDMTASTIENTSSVVRVTYSTRFVKNSFVSLNGKTKKCVCGYVGTFENFLRILETDSFLESHSHDQPEFVYSLLNSLIYNGMYSFHQEAINLGMFDLVDELGSLHIPQCLLLPNSDHGYTDDEIRCLKQTLDLENDIFYHLVEAPPRRSSATLPVMVEIYKALKKLFHGRVQLAVKHIGPKFLKYEFTTFTVNMKLRDNVEFSSTSKKLFGLLEFASTAESYKILGYTHTPVSFGRFSRPHVVLENEQNDEETLDFEGEWALRYSPKMPFLVVEDSSGFVSCLEHNMTKMTETLDSGTQYHLCNVTDYGVSSKLAMTIVKAQGISLDKVAVIFGRHKHLKKSHVYVAISRATSAKCLVLDQNPLRSLEDGEHATSSGQIVNAVNSPNTLLVY